jgi:hypothetical protein
MTRIRTLVATGIVGLVLVGCGSTGDTEGKEAQETEATETAAEGESGEGAAEEVTDEYAPDSEEVVAVPEGKERGADASAKKKESVLASESGEAKSRGRRGKKARIGVLNKSRRTLYFRCKYKYGHSWRWSRNLYKLPPNGGAVVPVSEARDMRIFTGASRGHLPFFTDVTQCYYIDKMSKGSELLYPPHRMYKLRSAKHVRFN